MMFRALKWIVPAIFILSATLGVICAIAVLHFVKKLW
jgi:hypothetical protein